MEAIAETEISLDQAQARLKAERATLLGELPAAEGAACDISESNTLFALEEWRQAYLGEIEHALEKLRGGSYGRCDSCGAPIEPERLATLPHSSLCLSCKTRRGFARSRALRTTVRALSNGEDD